MFLSRLLFHYRLLISHSVTLIAFQNSPSGLGPSGLRWARPSGEKVFYFKIVQAHILKFSFFLFSLKFPFGLVSNLLKNVLEFVSLKKCFVYPFFPMFINLFFHPFLSFHFVLIFFFFFCYAYFLFFIVHFFF